MLASPAQSAAPTAAETIVPVLERAFRAQSSFKSGRYSIPTHDGVLVVRRVHGTTAEIDVLDPVSRSAELGLLVNVAEALRDTGFSPDRRPWDVRVDWTVCATSERRAA